MGNQSSGTAEKATRKTRRKARKAAAYTPVAMKAVMGVGAPS